MPKSNKNKKPNNIEHFLPSLIPSFGLDSLLPDFGGIFTDIFSKILPDFGGFGLSEESIKQCSSLCSMILCLLILFAIIGSISPANKQNDEYSYDNSYDDVYFDDLSDTSYYR